MHADVSNVKQLLLQDNTPELNPWDWQVAPSNEVPSQSSPCSTILLLQSGIVACMPIAAANDDEFVNPAIDSNDAPVLNTEFDILLDDDETEASNEYWELFINDAEATEDSIGNVESRMIRKMNCRDLAIDVLFILQPHF